MSQNEALMVQWCALKCTILAPADKSAKVAQSDVQIIKLTSQLDRAQKNT